MAVMSTIRVSATHARNNFFELLNQVALGNTEVIIEKDSKEVAIISPKKQGTDLKALLEASKALRGTWKDYDPEDNPLRRRGAKKFLGRIDKALAKAKRI